MTLKTPYRNPKGFIVDLNIISEASLVGLRVLTADNVERMAGQRVLSRACEIFGVTLEQLGGPSRARQVAVARYAVARCLANVGYTTTTIANVLSREDHTTAVNWLNQSTLYEGFIPYQGILLELRAAWQILPRPLGHSS